MGHASLVQITLFVMWGTLPLDSALGASRAVMLTAGGDHTCAVTAGGGVQCWGEGQAGDAPLVVR